MDNRKAAVTRFLAPAEIAPTVRIANYITAGPDANWGDRTIPDLELIGVVEGRLRHVTAAGEAVVEPGDVLLILAGERHTLSVHGKRPAVISCIHGELVTEGTWQAHDYRLTVEPRPISRLVDPTPVLDAFRRCSEAFNGYGRLRVELARTIAREIWLRLLETWTQSESAGVSHRVAQMVRFLRERLTDGPGRRELAAAFHLSPEHVNYLFRQELGISPTQFVNRERILLAYRCIQEEGLSVKEAAARVGFGDSFYFSRLFKRIAGVNPSAV